MLARVFSASLENRASSNCVRSFATMGVEVQKISPGNGQYPQKGQTVSVHYVGTLQNGKEFDSSRKRGQPLDFKLGQGQVIRGWDEGIIQLSKGERAKLICSPDFAYGSKDVGGGLIPPNSTLIFDVELVNFR